jgi:VanZ family protein
MLWMLIGCAIVLGIWIGSLMPNPPALPNTGGDKVHHFAAYALAALWWCAVLQGLRRCALAVVALVLMGVVIEFLQGASGYRHFELADMIANSLGAMTGGLISLTLPASRFQSSSP